LQLKLDNTEVGARLRQARKSRGLTLAALAARSGISLSMISKAERGDVALTYDKFAALAHALDIAFDDLFGRRIGSPTSVSKPVFTQAGGQVVYQTPNYEYGMLASSLVGKRMVPMISRIHARHVSDFADHMRHQGEEFVLVLEGALSIHFENGECFALSRGDSLYFDSAAGHVYVTTSEHDAVVLVCCVERPIDSAAKLPSETDSPPRNNL